MMAKTKTRRTARKRSTTRTRRAEKTKKMAKMRKLIWTSTMTMKLLKMTRET